MADMDDFHNRLCVLAVFGTQEDREREAFRVLSAGTNYVNENLDLFGSPGTLPAVRKRTYTAAEIELLFAGWYNSYPRKKEPKAALRAFRKVLESGDASPEELEAGVKRYAQECATKRTEKQYVKHPATWLNKGCWADEPEFDNPTPRGPGSAQSAALARAAARARSRQS